MGDADEPEVKRSAGLSRGAVQALALGGVLAGCALWAAWHASHPAPLPPAPSPSLQTATASPQAEGVLLVVQAAPGAQILLDGRPVGQADAGGSWAVPAGDLQPGTRYRVSAVLGNRSTQAEFLARSGRHLLDLRAPQEEPAPDACLTRLPGLGPCLSVVNPENLPPRPTPEPRVGPCLKVRATPEPGPIEVAPPLPSPEPRVGPCLRVRATPDPGPDPRVGPCLSPVNPERLPPVRPCLSMPAPPDPKPSSPSVQVCLTLAPQSRHAPAEEGSRRSLLARFWDRLRPDLRERLGGGDEA